MTHPIPDSYWVVPGQLLAGEYPYSLDRAKAREKIAALLDAGIRSFVDLTETEDGLAPYDQVAVAIAREGGFEVRYRRMAIRDLGIPSVEHMHAVLDHLDAEIAAGRPVYVHCWGGIGRTGTVVGCWLRTQAACSGQEAIEKIAELRRGTPDGRKASPETSEQREFILGFARSTARPSA